MTIGWAFPRQFSISLYGILIRCLPKTRRRPRFQSVRKHRFLPRGSRFCRIQPCVFAPFATDFQFVHTTIKKTSKNFHFSLAWNEKPSTFAPAFRKGASSKDGWDAERERDGGEWWEKADAGRLKKDWKSSWRKRKRHYICNPFPKGKQIRRKPKVLWHYEHKREVRKNKHLDSIQKRRGQTI